ncbi:MAG: tetratricopeptide repeat protein [Methanoregula sp.]|jgi:FlaG/FlaF family flagellin (archaellin)/TM2 domain-containing membrane protein YozV
MEDSGNWCDRGITLLEEGDFTGAISAFDKAITFNQSVKDAWFNRGVACAQIVKYEQALHSFDQALLLDPDHENATKARTMVLGLWEKQKKTDLEKKMEPAPRRSYVSAPVSPKPGSSPGKELIRNPWYAVIFSFLFSGWGQWYNGERWKGLGFFGVTTFLGILNLVLSIILNGNLLVTSIFMILGLGIRVYGMYDAYSTSQGINSREIGFTRKSRLFWLPVILFVVMIIVTIILAAVIASFVFGMAGNIHHTKVVAVTAQQTSAGFIEMTYRGGPDADQVRQVVVTVTDSEDSSQTQNMKQDDDTDPLEVGSKISFNGRFIGKDHIVATAKFFDGTDQVIFDSYL